MNENFRPGILIVDDYVSMSSIIRKILIRLGYDDVEVADTGAEALEFLDRRPFDLVMCDWHMSPMSGLELLNFVRADERLKSIPVIMISGHGDMETISAAKKAGANDFIVKPFTAATVGEKLARVLGSGASR